LTAASTSTPRHDPVQSQDRVYAGPGLAVVADGVGSLPDSGAAAQITVEMLAAVADLSEFPGLGGLPAVGGFAVDPARVREALAAAHDRVRSEVGPTGASTALVLADDGRGGADVTWVGNGAVFVASLGHELHPGHGTRPLVHSTNLALPHVSYQHGLDVLDRIIGGATAPVPDWVRLGPARDDRVLLAVSDGLYSLEQDPVGRAPDGTRWRQVRPTQQALNELAENLLTWLEPGDLTSAEVERGCDEMLEELLDDGHLDDDASVAVMVLPGTDHDTERR